MLRQLPLGPQQKRTHGYYFFFPSYSPIFCFFRLVNPRLSQEQQQRNPSGRVTHSSMWRNQQQHATLLPACFVLLPSLQQSIPVLPQSSRLGYVCVGVLPMNLAEHPVCFSNQILLGTVPSRPFSSRSCHTHHVTPHTISRYLPLFYIE